MDFLIFLRMIRIDQRGNQISLSMLHSKGSIPKNSIILSYICFRPELVESRYLMNFKNRRVASSTQVCQGLSHYLPSSSRQLSPCPLSISIYLGFRRHFVMCTDWLFSLDEFNLLDECDQYVIGKRAYHMHGWFVRFLLFSLIYIIQVIT